MQFQGLIEIDGVTRFVEVQVNLFEFMALKEQKDGGHGAFNGARAIQAYDAETLQHSGGPGEDGEVWGKVGAGVLLYVTLDGSELSKRNMAGFRAALASPHCRLREISFQHCTVDRVTAEDDRSFPFHLLRCGMAVAEQRGQNSVAMRCAAPPYTF